MKSLDELFKELEKENKVQSLNLARELLKGFKMKNNFTTLNETLNNTLPAQSSPTVDER